MARKKYKPSLLALLILAAAGYFGYKAYAQIRIDNANRKIRQSGRDMLDSLDITPEQETEAAIDLYMENESAFRWWNPSTWF